MGAENSTPKPPPLATPLPKVEQPEKRKPAAPSNQYHDIKNPKYVEEDLRSSQSSESSISEESEGKREIKSVARTAVKKKESLVVPAVNPLKALEGLGTKAKVKKSEEMLRKMWKRPHPTWDKITDVTAICTEKTSIDAQVSDEVRKRINFNVDKTVYDIPLERCHLRIPKNRAARSCPDPWRRHGAHVKLCQVGGSMPENRNRNAKFVVVKKGTNPPPDPKTKPLLVMEDYMKLIRK